MEVFDEIVIHNGSEFRIYVVSAGGNEWAQVLREKQVIWQHSERQKGRPDKMGDRLSSIIRSGAFEALRNVTTVK